MDALELLVNKGRNIPVRLDLLPQLESQLSGAKTWKDRTARTFLRKNSHYTLMEVSEHVVCITKLFLNVFTYAFFTDYVIFISPTCKRNLHIQTSLNISCSLAILSG
jgi:hypothetical protein